MGKTAQYDEEAPLLPPDGGAGHASSGNAFYVHSPRKWRGQLLCCFSGCDLTAWASVIVFHFAPYLLFGFNMKKALQLSVAWQALLYFGLTVLAFPVIKVASQNVEANCRNGRGHESTPECQKAMGIVSTISGVYLVIYLGGILYFAYRRTQIREKFGIVGSRLGDFCAYFWCGPCALCQETRTLWHNNVNNGIWVGPIEFSAASPPSPYHPPNVNTIP